MKPLAAMLCTVALGACGQNEVYRPQNPSNLKEVEWATKRGTNSVSGKIEGQGSDGKTYPCARASLVPDSAYHRELMIKGHGTTEDGTFFTKDATPFVIYGDPSTRLVERSTHCGWKGNFYFEDIPNGVWYFSASGGSPWVGYSVQRRLELRGNEKIVINIP